MFMYYETDGDSGYYNIKLFRHEINAKDFHEANKNAYGNITSIAVQEDIAKVNPTPENLKCPDCDGEMVSRKSQYGAFWGCRKFPKCRGTRDTEGRTKEEAAAARDRERVSESNSSAEDMQTSSPTIVQNDQFRFRKS